MSAKSTLPAYVVSTLHAERKAQLQTMAAVVVYLFNEIKADRDTTGAGEKLYKVAQHRALKTWQNYVSTARAVATSGACSVKLESLHSEHSDPADSALAFAPWFEKQIKDKGYTLDVNDVALFAKGKPSLKAQAKAAEEAQKAIAVEQAKAEKELQTHAQTQADNEARTEAVAQAKAEQVIPEGTNESAPIPPAILPPMVAPLVIARRNSANKIDVEFGPDVTSEELEAIIAGIMQMQAEMGQREKAAA